MSKKAERIAPQGADQRKAQPFRRFNAGARRHSPRGDARYAEGAGLFRHLLRHAAAEYQDGLRRVYIAEIYFAGQTVQHIIPAYVFCIGQDDSILHESPFMNAVSHMMSRR